MITTDDFDGRFQMNGIHEVNANDLVGAPGNPANLGYRYARGVHAKSKLQVRSRDQLCVNLLLSRPILGNVFYDKLALSRIVNVASEGNPLKRFFFRYLGIVRANKGANLTFLVISFLASPIGPG